MTKRTVVTLTTLSLLLASFASFGYVPRPCVGGALPIATFRMLLAPAKGEGALVLSAVNIIRPGERLKYEPLLLPSAIRNGARVAVVLAPDDSAKQKGIEVLDAQPAKRAAEWTVPFRASVVGIVFGPRGLSVKKVGSLVKSNPELVPELAAYAQQTAEVNALVDALSQYEQSRPGSEDLNAALRGFSTNWGVALPRMTAGASTDQQASMLLQAVMPSLASYDPLTSPGSAVVASSAGLAASVAALFYGTPVGLAAGGAALFENMRTMLFPGTDFRSAFSETMLPNSMQLCSKDQKFVPRTRIAYLWMLKVPDAEAPAAVIPGDPTLPLGVKSELKIACATNAQLKLLERARNWEVVSGRHRVRVPAKVTVGAGADTLSLDLSRAKIEAGEYHLAAMWDWQPLVVEGTVHVRPYSDFSGVRMTPSSADRLIEASGPAKLDLVGADFEFVDSVRLKMPGGAFKDLGYTLPKGIDAGPQLEMSVRVNTHSLASGEYSLLLAQANGKAQAVPVVVHPPLPRIDNLPLRANLGEPSQAVVLRGTGLERIEKLTAPDTTWELAAAPEGSRDLTERGATLALHAGVTEGQVLGAAMQVEGIEQAVAIPRAIEVAPPRPKIESVNESFPQSGGVALRPGEIPSGLAVSFALHTLNLGARPEVALGCTNPEDTKVAFELAPGAPNGAAQLDFPGDGLLFLSLDPGAVGRSGCELTASVRTPDAGAADPVMLGRVILLPRIDKFTLTSQALGSSLYAGVLTGRNLQMIEKTGWNPQAGFPVQGIPTPVPGSVFEQTLHIELSWPPPAPHAPIYVWLRGENAGRKTNATY
ncbi:MAG: hypothetical protein ACRD3D_17580 [Terriglobia bacterium]